MVAKEGATMGNQLLSIIVGAGGNPQGPSPQITGDRTWLSAWNPATQKEAWRVVGGGSGTMTTAGNLVFRSESPQGQPGTLVAYRADNGEKLWSGSMGAGAGSGAISYEIDGVQYIAAIANARVAVFKLGGNAALPAAAAAVARVLNPPANFGTEAQLAAGRGFYTQSCTICHEGQATIGAPDLRYSPILASAEAFKAVVIDGAKADGGMKAFGGAFTLENVEAIRAHVVSLANTLKDNPAPARGAGPGGPGGAGPRAGGPGGAPRAGGPGGGAPRAGGPGGAPAGGAPAPQPAPQEQVGLHQ
jgi:mono/diheme cytochrome c family protein